MDKVNVIQGIDSVLEFGKHKGKVIHNVLESDPEYIDWCIKNIEWFKPNNKLVEETRLALLYKENRKENRHGKEK